MIKVHDKTFVPFISVDEIKEIVKKIANQINLDYAGKNPLFIGILNGSFMFASDLLKEIDLDCELTFVKFSSYSGQNSTGKINQLIGFNQNVKNRDVILLEDIVDTGQTLEKVLEILESKEVNSVKIATLLFKPEIFNKKYPVDYVGKDIPNKFVVGYGLDYDQQGRNLTEIYQIKE